MNSGRQSGQVSGAHLSALASEARSRLRVLIPGKDGEADSFCDILAANIQRWGYEVVFVTAAIMRDSQFWREIEGGVLLYDMNALLQHVDVLGNTSVELASTCNMDLVALKPDWPKARLSMVLSSSSISRHTLERPGAIALLHKPCDMRMLERYLRVFQQLLYNGVQPDDVYGLARPANLDWLTGRRDLVERHR